MASDNTAVSRCHVARQPILNRAQRVSGYQLTFRAGSSSDRAEISSELGATSRVIIDALVHIGPETLLGDAVGFVTCDASLAIAEMLSDLPDARLILQLPEMELISPGFKARCQEFHANGVRFAFNDYRKRDNRAELLEFAAYARVGAGSDTRSGLRATVRGLHRAGVQVIATQVETQTQYEMLSELDIDLYQGYFFAEPQVISADKIDPDRSAVLQLIVEIEKDTEIEVIADRVKRNATLSVSLLRLVNSLQMARSQKIDSVSQALMLMGRRGLARWLSLLLFAGGEDGGQSSPLFKLGATRGKIMECLEADLEERGSDQGSDAAERAFLTGMFSLVHVVLGSTPEEMLNEISVADEVREALLKRSGRLGDMLVLMEKVEAGDFDAVDSLLEGLSLSQDQLQEAQVEAYNWLKSM